MMKKLGMLILACVMSSSVLAQTQSPFVQLLTKIQMGNFMKNDIEFTAKRKGYVLNAEQTQCYVDKIQPEFFRRAELTAQQVFTPAQLAEFDKKFSPSVVQKINQAGLDTLELEKDFSTDELAQLQRVFNKDLEEKVSHAWDNTFLVEDSVLNPLLNLQPPPIHSEWDGYYRYIQYHQLTEQRAKDCGFEIDLP